MSYATPRQGTHWKHEGKGEEPTELYTTAARLDSTISPIIYPALQIQPTSFTPVLPPHSLGRCTPARHSAIKPTATPFTGHVVHKTSAKGTFSIEASEEDLAVVVGDEQSSLSREGVSCDVVPWDGGSSAWCDLPLQGCGRVCVRSVMINRQRRSCGVSHRGLQFHISVYQRDFDIR